MRILQSSKYQMAILTIVSLILADYFGIELSVEQLAAVALPIIAAIAGTAYEDSKKKTLEVNVSDEVLEELED